MKKVLTNLNQIDNVQKIFWKNGEYDDMGQCNVSLTGPHGRATELLEALGGIEHFVTRSPTPMFREVFLGMKSGEAGVSRLYDASKKSGCWK